MRVFCACEEPATVDLLGKVLSINLWFADGGTYVVLPAESYDVCRGGCTEGARFVELAAQGNKNTVGRQWVRAIVVGETGKAYDLSLRRVGKQASA